MILNNNIKYMYSISYCFPPLNNKGGAWSGDKKKYYFCIMNERDKLYKTIRICLVGIVSFFAILFVSYFLISLFSNIYQIFSY